MNDKPSKNYRKYTLLCVAATAVALVVCAASFSLKRGAVAVQGQPGQSSQAQSLPENLTSYYTPKPVPSQENGGSSGEEGQEEYLVTVYDGKIGVFRQGEDEPYLVADVEVYLLPPEDVAILERGIRAESFGAVKGILEDYR